MIQPKLKALEYPCSQHFEQQGGGTFDGSSLSTHRRRFSTAAHRNGDSRFTDYPPTASADAAITSTSRLKHEKEAENVSSSEASTEATTTLKAESTETSPAKSNIRPMTARERMITFPANVYQFMLDVYRYWDIRACAESPAPNAWKGQIPRQQREQQRLLREGAGTVIPLVALWIPPIIGYATMALAVSAPRQVLSRHFHNPYEQRQYALLQDEQRRRYWTNDAFVSLSQRLLDETCSAAKTPIVDQLSRGEMIALALAMGVGSSFPEPIPRLTAYVLNAPYCRRQVRYLLASVAEDDQCILREVSSSSDVPFHERVVAYLQVWSDMELLDACYLRGLALQDPDQSNEQAPSRWFLIKQLQQHLARYSSDATDAKRINNEDRYLWFWLQNIRAHQL